MSAHEAGKGPGRRAGADDAAYREGHDRIDWGAKGCKCGSAGQAAHSCPYKSDTDDDRETLCNCCAACTEECAGDV